MSGACRNVLFDTPFLFYAPFFLRKRCLSFALIDSNTKLNYYIPVNKVKFNGII